MLKCFGDDVAQDLLDKSPFTCRHRLMGHPALTLANLGRVIPALPPGQVFYSSGRLQKSDDFDRAHVDHRNGLTIEATIENIRTSNSYIMVRSPETDPSFAELHRELVSDVAALMRTRGVGRDPIDAKLYLFIASPDSVTPFHIDRYSTFLMQFQGEKEVVVFPPWSDQVVTARECEAFMARSGERPPFRPESEAVATRFHFRPGEALHIPFVAGHHVRNGPSEVSISMSIIFNTDETRAQIRALLFNHRIRPVMGRLGMAPEPIGNSPAKDALKAAAHGTAARLTRVLRAR